MKEKKYIVFERNLLELYERCHHHTCSGQKVVPKSFSSQFKVFAHCEACHHNQWHSQTKVGYINPGNLCISSAILILFGGGSPTKILRIMDFTNLKTNNVRTTCNLQYMRVWKGCHDHENQRGGQTTHNWRWRTKWLLVQTVKPKSRKELRLTVEGHC